MNGMWNALGMAQSVAMAASGAANAAYFAQRATRSTGGRRIAAVVLAAVFAGIALDGVVHLAGTVDAAVEVVRRAPLLVATLLTSALLRLGAGR